MTDPNQHPIDLDRPQVLDNYMPLDHAADLLVVGEFPDQVMEGWLALVDHLRDLRTFVIGEIEYALAIRILHPEEYRLFNVLQTQEYLLEEVRDQATYETIQMQSQIFLVALHNSVDPTLFAQDPRLQEWMDHLPPHTLNN